MIDSGEIFQSQACEHLRIFVVLFCASLALLLLINFREQLNYFKTQPAKIYGRPPLLLGRFQLPALNKRQFVAAGIILFLSLSAAAAGFLPRVFLFLALLGYFPYFNSIMSLSFVQRKTNLIPIILLILLFAPSADDPANQATAAWAIILIKAAIAQMYFSAGVQKLRRAGFGWASGASLRAYLMEHYLWGDTGWALLLARSPNLCKLLSVLILFFELTFWIIILLPALTYFYVFMALLFHLGTLLTMRINYLKYVSPAYLIFFTDAALQIKHAFER